MMQIVCGRGFAAWAMAVCPAALVMLASPTLAQDAAQNSATDQPTTHRHQVTPTAYDTLITCLQSAMSADHINNLAVRVVDGRLRQGWSPTEQAALEAAMNAATAQCGGEIPSGRQAATYGVIHIALQRARSVVMDRIEIPQVQRPAFEAVLQPFADALTLGDNIASGPDMPPEMLETARDALVNAGFVRGMSDHWLRGAIQSLSSDRLMRPRLEALLAAR